MKQSRILMLLGAFLALSGPATATTYPVTYTTGTEVAATSNGFTATGHDLSLTLDHSPTIGKELKVVENTGLGFISGEFTGLPQGQDIALNFNGIDHHFVANYYGGTGNDLVLVWQETEIYNWGKNDYGQLGNSTTSGTEATYPQRVTKTGVLAGKTIISIVQGKEHSLALSADGLVYAWGRNNQGQLGDNSTTNRSAPVAVNNSTGSALDGYKVVAIAAGDAHSLALREDGKVVAWGENSIGALGTGTGTGSLLIPTEVSTGVGSALTGGKKVVSIKAGAQFSLALCSDGKVVSWGANTYGQLGMGVIPVVNQALPVFVDTTTYSFLNGRTVVAIAAGSTYAMALCSDNVLAAWGNNAQQQLGYFVSTQPAYSKDPEKSFGNVAPRPVLQISTNGATSMVLCQDDTVYFWGNNSSRQMGNYGSGGGWYATASQHGTQPLLKGKKAVQIAAAESQTQILFSDGTLAVSGARPGNGTPVVSTVYIHTPVPYSSLALDRRFITLAAELGETHHGAIVAGPGAATPTLTVQYPAGTELEDNAEVNYGSLLPGYKLAKTYTIKNTGTASLTGLAATLDAGASTDPEFTISSITPSTVAPGATGTLKVTFAPTYAHSSTGVIDITATNTAQTFTLVASGTAGTDLETTFLTAGEAPVTASSVTLSTQQSQFALGHAPAVGTNLTVISNTGTAFIDGTFADLGHNAQVILTYDDQDYYFVADYYGGDGNDLVLHWQGTRPYGWGDNAVGKIGDNTVLDRNAPVPVVNTGVLAGKTVLRMASGGTHTLALLSDGNVAAWGENGSGQLGNNHATNADSSVPVLVDKSASSSLYNKRVVAVAAGYSFSLALCSDGSVHAWGYNASGQLGNNSAGNANSKIPVAVNTTNGVSSLYNQKVVSIATSSNSYHSLALCEDGTVVAWGRNTSGCLGDGTSTTRKVPVYVYNVSYHNVTRLTTGLNFSAALYGGGYVATWGENGYSQLGDGGTTDSNVAVDATVGDMRFTDISAGESHTVALRDDGTLYAWGRNHLSQCGTSSTSFTTLTAPYLLSASSYYGELYEKTVTRVSAGKYFSMALCSDQTLMSWGSNSVGQLGMDTLTTVSTYEAQEIRAVGLPLGHRFVSPAAGDLHAEALAAGPAISMQVDARLHGAVRQDDTVDFGARGILSDTVRTFTVLNAGSFPLTGLAVTKDGADASHFTAGSLGATTLAPGGSITFTVTFDPVYTTGLMNAAIHLDSNETTALDVNLTGRGMNNTTHTLTDGMPVPITANGVTASGSNLNLQLGFFDTDIVGRDLTVINNTSSEFITGTFNNLPHGGEVLLQGADGDYLYIADYRGGTGNDLVLRWHGSRLFGWGSASGSIVTTPAAIADPSGVLTGKNIVKMARGTSHYLVLCSDGTLATWGANSYGQLGDNTLVDRWTPALVYRTTGALAGKTVIDIAASYYVSFAICSDGTIAAWGDNSDGNLGDNTVTNRKVAVAVNAVSGTSALYGKTPVKIQTAGLNTVVLCSDGTLVTWGRGTRLSDNVGVDKRVPVAVYTGYGALKNKEVRQVMLSEYGPVALCSDGSVAVMSSEDSGGHGLPGRPYGQPLDTSPASAMYGRTAVAVGGGTSPPMVLTSDGTVITWSPIPAVVLNDGLSRRPVAINTENGISALHGKVVTRIYGDNATAFAFCEDGTLAAWGKNDYADVGDGSTVTRHAPVLVSTAGLAADQRFTGELANGGRLALVSGHQALLHVYEEYGDPLNYNDDILRKNGASTSLGTVYVQSGVTVDVTSKQKSFRVEDIGTKDLDNVNISIVGTHAAYFSVDSSAYPHLTVTYTPSVAGNHTAALRITSNASGSYATYDVTLTGTAGTGYVDAVYDSSGEVPLNTSVAFTATGKYLNATLNFEPTPGRDLMLINNTGIAPVTGYFSYAPNGTNLAMTYDGSTYYYAINYYGGDGNDVVLVWTNNAAYGWGENGEGQLGNSTTTDTTAPGAVYSAGVLSGKTILSTANGGGHTLVLCDDGKVYAWGDNQYGQLGDNTLVDKTTPVAVDTTYSVSALYNKRVLAIAAGKYHSMALYLDESIYPNVVCVATWGINNAGQLGDGTFVSKSVPVAVNAAGTSALYNSTDAKRENVYAIAAGDYHSMALYLDTSPATDIVTVATWGDNTHRQLGHNSAAASSSIPVTVTTASGAFITYKNASGIAAGGNHCLAIRRDTLGNQVAVGWGKNDQGQVGNNAVSAYVAIPTAVHTAFGDLNGRQVTSLAAGANHSLALYTGVSSTGISAWGDNAFGQLGNNTTTDSVYPVGVSTSLDSPTQISAGGNRSYLLSPGYPVYYIKGWGSNLDGRLGDDNYDAMLGLYPDALTPAFIDDSSLGYQETYTQLPRGPSADHSIIVKSKP